MGVRRAQDGDSGTADTSQALGLALTGAYVLLGLQLVGMLCLSWFVYHRWSNTWDYAIRYQGWWGIAHGNLDPFSSVANRFFLQDHFALINWPLAVLSRLWPHGLWPLWIQDLMVAAAEVGALRIVTDSFEGGRWSRLLPGWSAVCLVTVMLVANPFIYESVGFDFHYQSVGAACFALLAWRELMAGSRAGLVVFSVLCLACGDIAATYLIALGVSAMLAGRATRRQGAVMTTGGFFWMALVIALGGNRGSSLFTHYGYLAGAAPGAAVSIGAVLKGAFGDPGRWLAHLWSDRVDLFAYAGSAGLIGLFSPWGVLPILVLTENGLAAGRGVAATAYESFGAVIFLIPSSVLVLGRFARRLEVTAPSRANPKCWRSALSSALASVLGLYALGWGVLWVPRVPGRWVQVSAATASTLDRVKQMIPGTSEVVASQGIIGRFADRRWLYRLSHGTTVALETPETFFVIVPEAGIELTTIQECEDLIGQLRGPLGGLLLLHADGVWLLELHRGPALRSVSVTSRPMTLPAWIGQTATGRVIRQGPVPSWHVAQVSSKPGRLLFGIAWDARPGSYALATSISNRSGVQIEVRDTSNGRVLARRRVGPGPLRSVTTDLTVPPDRNDRPYGGVIPFRFSPAHPDPGQRLELVIRSPGTGAVSIYRAALRPDR